MLYPINKTLQTVGSFFVFQLETPLKKVIEPISFSDEVDGLSYHIQLIREVSYSYDSEQWTPWTRVTGQSMEAIDITNPEIHLKFRYTIKSNLTGNAVTIKHMELWVVTPEAEANPVYKPQFAFELPPIAPIDYKALGQSYIGLQTDINYYLNKISMFEVDYVRTEPNAKSIDVFLQEHSIKHAVEKKCIKVVVPDNKIPDPKHKYDEWGINFEEFEIHLSPVYFEEMFGKGKSPRIEDFMYFPLVNRIYYVYSSYLDRGVNQSAAYWRLSLKKYDENTSVIKDTDDINTMLEEKVLNSEEMFRKEFDEEHIDVMNDMQDSLKTIGSDIVRDVIAEGMNVVMEDVMNNGNYVMRSYYDMTTLDRDDVAVIYKKEIGLAMSESISFTCWFRSVADTTILHPFDIITQTRLTQNLLKVTVNKDTRKYLKLLPGDTIYSGSNFYDIESMEDADILILNTKNAISATTGYKRSKKVSIITASNGDAQIPVITILQNDVLRLWNPGKVYDITGLDLEDDVWYCLVVNISNEHNYIGAYVWTITDRGSTHPTRYNTNLTQHFKKEMSKPTELLIPANSIPMIPASRAHIGCVRIFKKAMDHEIQSMVMSNRDVEKPSMAYLIDDAAPVVNIGNIDRGQIRTEQRKGRK